MIIDTINIGGVLIPYRDIRAYRLINREFLFRPAFRQVNSAILKKYEFAQFVPYCALLSEQEYCLLNPSNKQSSSETFGTLKSIVIDYATEGHLLQNIALNAADFIVDLAIDKAKNRVSNNKFYCLGYNSNVFITKINNVPPLLVNNLGYPIEITNTSTKHLLPKGYYPKVEQGLALHVTTSFQQYLFFGYGIHIDDPRQTLATLTREIAIRRNMPPRRF